MTRRQLLSALSIYHSLSLIRPPIPRLVPRMGCSLWCLRITQDSEHQAVFILFTGSHHSGRHGKWLCIGNLEATEDLSYGS